MSTVVLRSLIENNAALAANNSGSDPDTGVALTILIIAGVLAFAAAAKAVGPVARAFKTLLWLALSALFALLAIGVGVSLAVAHLG